MRGSFVEVSITLRLFSSSPAPSSYMKTIGPLLASAIIRATSESVFGASIWGTVSDVESAAHQRNGIPILYLPESPPFVEYVIDESYLQNFTHCEQIVLDRLSSVDWECVNQPR